MSLYRKFKTDPKLEDEGIWLDYGESGRIRIARAGGSNKRYLAAMERVYRKHKNLIRLDLLETAQGIVALREAYADTIVLGWEGITDEEGRPLECTRENVVKLFTDLPDLFIDVRNQADNFALFRTHLEEIASKN